MNRYIVTVTVTELYSVEVEEKAEEIELSISPQVEFLATELKEDKKDE